MHFLSLKKSKRSLNLSWARYDRTHATTTNVMGRSNDTPTGGFEPPAGYSMAHLVHDLPMDGKELWVIRLPDGIDTQQLDGVTMPLSMLEQEAPGTLASITVSDDAMYDVHVAAQTTSERAASGSSQLIDMAGPSPGGVFLDPSFLSTSKSAGVASEMIGITALVPQDDGSLSMMPITRRLFLARQAPPSKRRTEISTAPPPKHTQPWDRLKGSFRPTGSIRPSSSSSSSSQAMAVDEADTTASHSKKKSSKSSKDTDKAEKKRKKHTNDEPAKKKQKQ